MCALETQAIREIASEKIIARSPYPLSLSPNKFEIPFQPPPKIPNGRRKIYLGQTGITIRSETLSFRYETQEMNNQATNQGQTFLKYFD